MPRNRHEVLTRAHRHDTPTLTQPADPKGHGRGSTGETRPSSCLFWPPHNAWTKV
jgi:hypothetical protein